MSESSRKSIKEKIREFCFENDYPVFFPDQIEKHGNTLILTRSDGLQITFSVVVRPTMINDDSTIHIDTKLNETIHRATLNNSGLL